MTEDFVLNLAKEAIWTTVILSAPLLLGALATGLIISIIQAITQINEATLTFIPKMFAIAILLVVLAPWMTQVMTSYTTELITSFPEVLR